MAAEFALENRRAVYHIYNSLQREELENFLYSISGNVMNEYVETMSKDIGASKEDKELIVEFYQSALTGMVLRWIATGMKGDPDSKIERIGVLFDGNIEISLKRSEELNKYNKTNRN